MARRIRAFVAGWGLVAALFAAVYYFLGVCRFTSSVDGKLVAGAEIYQDGKMIGKTPLDRRFSPGLRTFEIHAPPGAEGSVTCTIGTFLMGATCDAPFESAEALSRVAVRVAQDVQRNLVVIAPPAIPCDPSVDYCAYVSGKSLCLSPTDCDGDGIGDGVDTDPCHCGSQTVKVIAPPATTN